MAETPTQPPQPALTGDTTPQAIAALYRIERASVLNQAMRTDSLNLTFAESDAAADARDFTLLTSGQQQAAAVAAMARSARQHVAYRDALATIAPELAATVSAHSGERLSLTQRSFRTQDGGELASRLDATDSDAALAASIDGHRRAYVAGAAKDGPAHHEANRSTARKDIESLTAMSATWLRRDTLVAIAESATLSQTYRDEFAKLRPDLLAEADVSRQEARHHSMGLLTLERQAALKRSGDPEMARSVARADVDALRSMTTSLDRSAELRGMAELIRDNAAYREEALLADAKLVELATDVNLVQSLQAQAREHVHFLRLPPEGSDADLKEAIDADMQLLGRIKDPAERRNAFRALALNDSAYVHKLFEAHPDLRAEMDRVVDDDIIREMVQGHAVLARPGLDAEREVRAKARADRDALGRLATASARIEAEAIIAEAVEEQAGYGAAVQHLDEVDRVAAIRQRVAAGQDAAALLPEDASAMAEADLHDLREVRSQDQLLAIAPEIARRREHPAYQSALVTADFKTARAMESLAWEAQAAAERERLSAPRRPLQGVLLEQGRAPYQNDTSQPETFFARYLDDSGREGTAWGRHLQVALSDAGVAPGQRFALARLPSTAASSEASLSTLPCDLSEFDVVAVEDDPELKPSEQAATPAAVDPVPVAAPLAPSAATQPNGSTLAPPVASVAPHVAAPPVANVVPPSRTFGRAAANQARSEADADQAAEQRPTTPAAATAAPTVPVTPAPAPASTKAPAQSPKAAPPIVPTKNGFTSGDAPTDRPTPLDFSKLLDSVTYETQKDGSVLYLLHKKPAFVDHGQQILMHKEGDGDEQAILAAILLAKQKWGGKLELTGTEEFKARALAAMVKHGVEVQFKNPEQEARWRDLKKARTEALAAEQAAQPAGPKPLIGTPSTALNSITPGDTPPSGGAQSVAPLVAAAASGTLAADLAPIRARDWWIAEREIVKKSAEPKFVQQELTRLGAEPAADQVFWFDKSGRRADPPSDADAYVRALPGPPDPSQTPVAAQLVLRSVTKTGENRYETTALLFKPATGDHLQGFVVVNGVKRHVIAQVTQRPADPATGELRPSFLRLLERAGDDKKSHWREIGYGNAINQRQDKKPVYFDELMLTVGSDLVKARVLSDVDDSLHRRLGFSADRTPRNAAVPRAELAGGAGPNAGPAAGDREAAAGMSTTLPTHAPSAPRQAPRPRAAA